MKFHVAGLVTIIILGTVLGNCDVFSFAIRKQKQLRTLSSTISKIMSQYLFIRVLSLIVNNLLIGLVSQYTDPRQRGIRKDLGAGNFK